MFAVFKDLFFSIKDRLTGEFGESIRSDVIPYASFITKDSLITKNGYIITVIDIESFDEVNKDVRVLVKKALSENVEGSNYAFWFQTMKIGVADGLSEKEELTSIERVVNRMIRDNHVLSYKYVLKNFIFLIHNTIDLHKTKIKDIFSNFGSFFIHNKHDKYISDVLKNTSKLTNNLVNSLEQNGVKSKRIDIFSEVNFIELLKFPVSFDCRNFFNKTNDKMEMPICDLSDLFSDIRVSFVDSTCKLRSAKKEKNLAIFKIKDVSTLSHLVIKKILNITCKNILINEVAVPCDKKQVKKYHKNQLDIEYYGGDVDLILKSTGILDAVNSKVNYSVEMQITFASENEDEVLDGVKDFYRICNKYGIVAFFNEVDIERSFYLNLPGNFTYMENDLMYSSVKDIGNFLFLSKDFNPSEVNYLKTIYLSLPIFYFKSQETGEFLPFDMSSELPNIFILGDNIDAESNKIHNLLMNRIISSNDDNIVYNISNDNSHVIFGLCHNGKIFQIKRGLSKSIFNPMLIFSLLTGFETVKKEYFIDFFILLFSVSKKLSTNSIRGDLSLIFDKIILNPNNYKSIHDLHDLFKDTKYYDIFNTWANAEDGDPFCIFNCGEGSDVLFDFTKNFQYFEFLMDYDSIDEKFNSIISGYIIYQISFLNIINRKNRFISISGLENILGSEFYRYNFEKLSNFANYCKVYFFYRLKNEFLVHNIKFDLKLFSNFCGRFVLQANTNNFDFEQLSIKEGLNDIMYEVNKFSSNKFFYFSVQAGNKISAIVNIHDEHFYGYIDNIFNVSEHCYSEFNKYLESKQKNLFELKEDDILNEFYVFFKKRGFLTW